MKRRLVALYDSQFDENGPICRRMAFAGQMTLATLVRSVTLFDRKRNNKIFFFFASLKKITFPSRAKSHKVRQ